jgi:hypothetical protein
MTQPRYCEDCRWFDKGSCDAPGNRIPWHETGLITRVKNPPRHLHRWLTASHQRIFWGVFAFAFRACGRGGRWFEAK